MTAVVCHWQLSTGYWLIILLNLIKTLFMQAASSVSCISLAWPNPNEDTNSSVVGKVRKTLKGCLSCCFVCCL